MDQTTVKTVPVKWIEKLPPLRFRTCFAILTAVMSLVFLPVVVIAYRSNGSDGLRAAAIAAGVCWLGSTLALAGTSRFGRIGLHGPLYTLAFGLVFGCAFPFIVGLVLNRSGGALSEAGVFGLTVVFFQFALVTSTLLSLCLVKSAR